MLLLPKSRDDLEGRRLSLSDATWAEGPGFAPHILYANLRFDLNDQIAEKRRFVDWCYRVGPHWSKERILKYLASQQSHFRDCLRWLVGDAVVDFEEFRKELGPASQDFPDHDLLQEWRTIGEASFLQLHGVSHCHISVEPKAGPSETNVWLFFGINLGPRKPRDPIDMICWHLLYLLMRDGRLNVRKCRHCETFFRPRTRRKQYCSDLCRAKAHAKTSEEQREYMRNYRATKKRLRAAKTSGRANSHRP